MKRIDFYIFGWRLNVYFSLFVGIIFVLFLIGVSLVNAGTLFLGAAFGIYPLALLLLSIFIVVDLWKQLGKRLRLYESEAITMSPREEKRLTDVVEDARAAYGTRVPRAIHGRVIKTSLQWQCFTVSFNEVHNIYVTLGFLIWWSRFQRLGDAVIAHELGHIINRDSRVWTRWSFATDFFGKRYAKWSLLILGMGALLTFFTNKIQFLTMTMTTLVMFLMVFLMVPRGALNFSEFAADGVAVRLGYFNELKQLLEQTEGTKGGLSLRDIFAIYASPKVRLRMVLGLEKQIERNGGWEGVGGPYSAR